MTEHHHKHNHSHGHGAEAGKKALLIGFVIITAFMFVEFIGGWVSGSLALISDAGHMLSDAFALGLSLSAIIAGQRIANKRKTYGYKRFEVLAAFFNALAIFLIAVFIIKEALYRMQNPAPILSGPMFIIAVIGLLVNIAVLFILKSGGHEGNINVKSALLHVIGDMLGSVGVIIAAGLIYFFGWYIADPVISVVVALLILYSAWKIFSETINILLEGTPAHIDIDELKVQISKTPGVCEVHDIHIWSISSSFLILTAHISVKENTDRDALLSKLKKLISDAAGITHVTIQLNGEGCADNACNCY